MKFKKIQGIQEVQGNPRKSRKSKKPRKSEKGNPKNSENPRNPGKLRKSMNLKNPRKFTYFRNPRKFMNPRMKKVQKVAKGTILSSAQNLASKPLFLTIKGRHFLEALRGGTHSPKH